MKKKTTLAALLLAAVMVTPSYGAVPALINGAADVLENKVNWGTGLVMGVCYSMWSSSQVALPATGTQGQLIKVVSRYVERHPEYHHKHANDLVRMACKEAWPNENKHIFVSR